MGNLYIVMEYAENGNLYKQMSKQGTFHEKDAFNIFSQTCLGIEFLHKQNIIHRDLKPENLLIDKKKRIKICDFGWSAEASNNSIQRKTFCGTYDYMAPEVMLGKPQSFAVDIWCLGILLYELLHGKSPYFNVNQHEKLDRIKKRHPISFNSKISPECQD